MTWLFGPSLEDKELERRLRESERAEEEARTRHRAKAINSTIQADDAREAIEAMLQGLERRRQERASRHS
jgi:hypothetical protein